MYFNFLKLNLILFFYVEPYATAIFVGKIGHIEAISHSSSNLLLVGLSSDLGPSGLLPLCWDPQPVMTSLTICLMEGRWLLPKCYLCKKLSGINIRDGTQEEGPLKPQMLSNE